MFAGFVDKLRCRRKATARVLDHSMILYGSNMSDSNRHNNDPLPAAILGRAHGRIKGGQHLRYPQDARFSDLLLTLFERAQIPVESIGDSAGTLVGGLNVNEHPTIRRPTVASPQCTCSRTACALARAVRERTTICSRLPKLAISAAALRLLDAGADVDARAAGRYDGGDVGRV